MSKAHEVYEAQLLLQEGELGPLTQRQKNAIFAMVKAGYDSAIDSVKAGGPTAYRYWKDKFGCFEYSDTPLVFPSVPAGTVMRNLYELMGEE